VSLAARGLDRPLAFQTCPGCSRRNPAEAVYCYFDGYRLPGAADVADDSVRRGQRFPFPFVFSSGLACATFDELARACQDNWEEAREALRQGSLQSFLAGLGRLDLAGAAREAARYPDPDRGLDQLLAALPANLAPARLFVEPREVHLGSLRPGDPEPRSFPLRLRNGGQRLLFGSVRADDYDWLALGSPAGGPEKLFDCTAEATLPVYVRPQGLRARDKPLEATLEVKSNGGTVGVVVRAEVPVRPFPTGPLAGARTPRQLAEKVRESPRETAIFLENGAVARWYADNGWTYPIQGPAGSGLGAVQQFFEALGLARPPKVEVRPPTLALRGTPGTPLHACVQATTQEKRAVWAHAKSDQPWLQVGTPQADGPTATLPLVAVVPDQPGATLQAQLKVTANGNQRFEVPVVLTIDAGVGAASRAAPEGPARLAGPTPAAASRAAPGERGVSGPASGGCQAPVTAVKGIDTPRPPGVPTALRVSRRTRAVRLAPAVLLALVILGIGVRDALLQRSACTAAETGRALAFSFHEGKEGDRLDSQLPDRTMRFGLRMAGPPETAGAGRRRLTADEWGRTNNTCLRIDGSERLFGSAPGRWLGPAAPDWEDARGVRHEGVRCTWVWEDKKVQATQFVELVPGEEGNRLDTCLVRYLVENTDSAPHNVGLRFLLDTFIGGNDGVPFTIPGEPNLCADSRDFQGTIPAFIQALEHEDLANPGTVAHLKLKLGEREPPTRVTLGAWPDEALALLLGVGQARGVRTLWDVPVRPMKTLWPYDSAVVLYWNDKPLPPGGRREVGFAYGLGNIASSGKLLVAVDGSFKPGGELTVTVLVNAPAPGEKVTLAVPAGFEVQGEATQAVPALPADADSRNRPVTWKVKAGPLGAHTLEVRSSTGASQAKPIRIKETSIFD
jgi:hypothetical protein